MIGSEQASVFEDREIFGDWRVEKFDENGGCKARVFTGPNARQQHEAREPYLGALRITG
jgi:hypothetical protein